MEERIVLSFGASGALQAVPGVVVDHAGAGPLVSQGPVGYTPQQLRAAYGLDQISFAGIKGDGSGQTIVIIDAYDNPGFVDSTDPSFDTSALHRFDQAYGLPDPPSFKKVNQNGDGGPLPQAAGVSGWGVEIALDVEWAHAMAPGANIILVEANAPDDSLDVAELTAGRLGSVVSMSYGWDNPNEAPEELDHDATYNQPGVVFLASSGDSGVPSSYAAYSPYVVAVGGTSLQGLDAQGSYPGTGADGEIGWSGSGGGYSDYEPEPSWQQSVQQTGNRSVPDISADADPHTGVGVYDPYDFSVIAPWAQVGGTSLSSPLMAGLFAVVDEGRALNGGASFSSTEALTALYDLAGAHPGDFHDVLYGDNGYSAGPGYDLVTGLGAPDGAALVPDLAAYGLTGSPSLLSIDVTPSTSNLGLGLSEQYTATGTFAGGLKLDLTRSVDWASSNASAATINGLGVASAVGVGQASITASLPGVTSGVAALNVLPVVSLAVGPPGPYVPVLLSQQFTATATYSDGSTGDVTAAASWTSSNPAVATIDASGSATANGLGTSTITATLGGATSPGDVLTAIAPSFVVNTTADVVDYQDGETSLREAVLAANVYIGQVVTFDPNVFASPQTIALKLGALDLLNPSGVESIVGPAAGVTVDAGGKSRAFEVAPLVSASISGVTMADGAAAGGGGDLFSAHANLNLTDCSFTGGYAAYGGGLYLFSGSARLTRVTVSGASAANAGGGIAAVRTALTMTDCTVSGDSAGIAGGGLYLYSGSAALTKTAIRDDSASAVGGGVAAIRNQFTMTGCTVSGDAAGAAGGGLYLYSDSAALTGVAVSGNSASAAGGGILSSGGRLSVLQSTVDDNSAGGAGGGLFLASDARLTVVEVSGNTSGEIGGGVWNLGSLVMSQSAVDGNSAVGYYADGGGLANSGTAALSDTTITGNRANGYYAYGGGLWNRGTASLSGCTVSGNSIVSDGVARGGGLYNAGSLDLMGVVVQGNTASGGFGPQGGGLFTSGASTLTACTISGNAANQGGGLFNAGASTLFLCTISGNAAANDGGGVFTRGSAWTYLYAGGYHSYLYPGTTTLTNCTVSGNTAGRNGGGVFSSAVGVTAANNTTISGNSAANGGGVFTAGDAFVVGLWQPNGDGTGSIVWVFVPFQGETDLTNCTVTGNTATGDGGGLATSGLGVVAAVGTSFSRNTAVNGGGVFTDGTTFHSYDSSGAPVPIDTVGVAALESCNVFGNSASSTGGGVGNGGLGVTLVAQSSVSSNTADAGGGLANSGSLVVLGGTVQNNKAKSQGGGISTTGGEVDLEGVTLAMNSVLSQGTALGGGVASEDSVLSMAQCVIQANRAAGQQAYGGGVYALNSTVTLKQTLVASNQAQGAQDANGGGVYSEGGTLDLIAALVSGNTSSSGENDVYRKP